MAELRQQGYESLRGVQINNSYAFNYEFIAQASLKNIY